jgi:hypothetical protein
MFNDNDYQEIFIDIDTMEKVRSYYSQEYRESTRMDVDSDSIKPCAVCLGDTGDIHKCEGCRISYHMVFIYLI